MGFVPLLPLSSKACLVDFLKPFHLDEVQFGGGKCLLQEQLSTAQCDATSWTASRDRDAGSHGLKSAFPEPLHATSTCRCLFTPGTTTGRGLCRYDAVGCHCHTRHRLHNQESRSWAFRVSLSKCFLGPQLTFEREQEREATPGNPCRHGLPDGNTVALATGHETRCASAPSSAHCRAGAGRLPAQREHRQLQRGAQGLQ